jgi:hypothetical protein
MNPEPLIVNVSPAPPESTTDGETFAIEGTGLFDPVTCNVSVALCCKLPEVPVTVSVNVPGEAAEEAAMVKVEDALPPESGVTVVGENVALTPLGTPAMLNPVALLNPFKLEIVTVDDAELPPAVTASEDGETPILKSALACATTVRARLVLWVVLPEVPEMVRVNGPVVAVDEAVRVRVEVTLPPEGGVTVAGENEAVTPPGSPEMLRLVALLKPLILPTVTVAVPLVPRVTLSEAGATLTLKSGCGTDPTVMVRFTRWLMLPLLPVIFKTKVPVVAEEDAVSVRVEDAVPPAGGVTVAGAKDAVTPAGSPETLRLVAE